MPKTLRWCSPVSVAVNDTDSSSVIVVLLASGADDLTAVDMTEKFVACAIERGRLVFLGQGRPPEDREERRGIERPRAAFGVEKTSAALNITNPSEHANARSSPLRGLRRVSRGPGPPWVVGAALP